MWVAIKDRVNILNNATGAGAGQGYGLSVPHHTFTFSKTVTGTFSVLVVNYEGSLDNVTWFQLGTDNTLVAGATFTVDKPVLWVRANVATFTGGTTVSVDMLPAGIG
jgi:hypothetical protein